MGLLRPADTQVFTSRCNFTFMSSVIGCEIAQIQLEMVPSIIVGIRVYSADPVRNKALYALLSVVCFEM